MTSKVRTFGQEEVARGAYDHYWDEHGDEHRHDLGVYRVAFLCSTGHRWTEAAMRPCDVCTFIQPTVQVERLSDLPMEGNADGAV